MLRVMRQRVAADTNNQSPATTNPGQQSEMRATSRAWHRGKRTDGE